MDVGEMGSAAGPERTDYAGEAHQRARQMRSLPAEQLVAEVLFSLVNAAQIKLGRRDARLLIDLGAVVQEHARPYLSGDLATQVDQLLAQLRMGQVSAEGRANQTGEREENDLDRVPTSPPASSPPAPSPR